MALEILEKIKSGRDNPVSNLDLTTSQPMGQINSVSKLSDVKPTDWAYQSLQSLAERYNCLVGYPSLTFQGKRTLTRWEFAAGLNSCLSNIEGFLAEGKSLLREDITILQRLTKDFEAELPAINRKIETLESRVTFLEDRQFSTTTKLNAEAIFVFTNSNNPTFAGRRNNQNRTDSELNQPAWGFRTTLNFDTSFNGRDQLRTRFRAGSITPPLTDQTNMGGFETEIGFGGDVRITKLQYHTYLPVGLYNVSQGDFQERFYAVLSGFGTGLDEIFFETYNPFIIGAKDAYTQFAVYNPIFRQPTGVGAGFGYIASERFALAIAYQARGKDNEAANSQPGRGLFNGSFSTGINAAIGVTEDWWLGLTYLYGFYTEDRVTLLGNTGSDRTFDPFDGNPTQSHNIGFQTTALIDNRVNLAGWFGWTRAVDATNGDRATILNWALTVTWLDAFAEGNKAGLIVGMPPKLTSIDGSRPDPDTALQIEAFYTHKVNQNIFINPGFYTIFNPENDRRNDTVFVGLFRTIFEF